MNAQAQRIPITYRNLLPEEEAALRAFAEAHHLKKNRSPGCASWKDELSMVYWYNARVWDGRGSDKFVPGMGNVLHGIRNEFGPTWLYDVYKLTK